MTRKFLITFTVILALGALAGAQVRTGAIDGKVLDEQGGVMPGVTVTLTGENVIGANSTVTGVDGTYRFRALEPGTYNLLFELPGFATFNREGILIRGARTITIDATLQVAGVAETITVTGESPLIDVKQTVVGATFDDIKQEIPGATDTWALLGQTPGVRMAGFDVGGSHKSQQSGYDSFGIESQNQVVIEGVITTEGTGGTNWYFDYYATEEVRISASSGADVEMESPGAAYVSVIKSGGNDFSSLVNYDFTKEGMVGDNLDEATRAQGYTGNQTLDFWEVHADVGGPIVRDNAWFFVAYNKFITDTQVSGQDPADGTDKSEIYNVSTKISWQFTEKDKLIGFLLRAKKYKPWRGLSATIPLDSTRENINPGWGGKVEWQRVWNDRFFSSLTVSELYDDWGLNPRVDGLTNPARENLDTGMRSGAGFYPFWAYWRDYPTFVFNSNYYIPEAAGSHDFKIGAMHRYENHYEGASARSGPIYYYDDGDGNPVEVEISDWPLDDSQNNAPSNRNRRFGFWIQDNWSINDRVTVNMGVRWLRQHSSYGDTPKADQALISSQYYPWLTGLFSTATVPGANVGTWSGLAPRLGVTYDLTGEGRTVLKASYGRYYNNLSVGVASDANPGGENWVYFDFQDLDGNRILTRDESIGRQELIQNTGGGGGGSDTIDPDAPLPYSDQFQVSVEHQFPGEIALRGLYVRKTHDRLGLGGVTWNRAQHPYLTVPFQTEDPGAPGQMLNLLTTPADKFGSDNIMTEYPDANSYNYDTISFSLEKRFAQGLFVNGSFDYQWRSEGRRADSISTSPLDADPISIGWYQNHSADVGTIQDTTNWNFRMLARYQLPYDIGLATNVRLQSGWNYARRVDLRIYAGTGVSSPGAESLGTQRIFVEDIKNNRSETVPIWDFRIDKRFALGKAGAFTFLFDVYNLMNSNAITNFSVRTGSFGEVYAALPPRTLKIGFRWSY